MSNPGSAASTVEISGVRFSLEEDWTSCGDGNAYATLRTPNIVVPLPGKALTRWRLKAGAVAALHGDYTTGRPRPTFTVPVPMTAKSLSMAFGSLFQDNDYSAGDYTFTPQGAAIRTTPMALGIEGGIVGDASGGMVYKAVGNVVNSVRINIPPSEDDGGQVMVDLGIIGCNSTRSNAFTLASASIDTATPKLSTNHTFTIAGSSAKVVSMDVTTTNGAGRSPNIGSTADAIFLGETGITGNVTVMYTKGSGDEFDDLADANEASPPTQTTVVITVASFLSMTFKAVIGEPTFQEADPVVLASFPFEIADDTSTAVSYVVTAGSELLAGWGTA